MKGQKSMAVVNVGNVAAIEEEKFTPTSPNFSKSAYHAHIQEIKSKLARNVVLTEVEQKTVMKILTEEEYRYSENA